ncbi:MAG: hypothetical protein K2O24_08265 [Muribaculaceae bacterium]|nr:hypothetical protein [Muribaculaceae bacterium]
MPTTVNPAGAGQRFSLPRFRSLMARYLHEEGRILLLSLLLVFGVLLSVFIIAALETSYRHSRPDGIDGIWQDECFMETVFFTVYAAFCGAMMFSGMATREQRLGALTLPASTTEKFLVRFVIYVPCAIVAFLVCVWLADMVRYLFVITCIDHAEGSVRLLPIPYILTMGNVMELTSYTAHMNAVGIELARLTNAGYALTSWSMVLTAQAAYAMGSLIFPRKAIIKTSVSIFMLCMVLAGLWWASSEIFGLSDARAVSQDPTAAALTVRGVVTGVVVILLYCWSYFRLREEEVVERW